MIGRFGLLISLFALASCASAPATPAVQLYAMDCGRTTPANAGRELVIPCYLIRHPNGDLLWDAGLPPLPPGGAGGSRIDRPLVDQLQQIGVAPADVEFVSVSHTHPDHVGNAARFTSATWIVDADERAWMFRDEARAAPAFPVVAPLERFRTQLIEGDGDYDVFGDGSVVIVQTPGHTPGSASLLVHFAHAQPVLLVGDLYAWNPNATISEQSRASMAKAEALAAREHARMMRAHFVEDFDTLPRFPAPLN